ncbi:hypothetical protein CR513_40921, partial [Mucuna pruriens]
DVTIRESLKRLKEEARLLVNIGLFLWTTSGVFGRHLALLDNGPFGHTSLWTTPRVIVLSYVNSDLISEIQRLSLASQNLISRIFRFYFKTVRRHEKDPRRTPLDTLKCKIPPFVGDEEAESYLEWEMKVRMVTYEFNGYALVEVRESKRRHIDTWLDLRRKMRTRFVPTSYAQDLYNKLQRMYQGSKSIEEYFKEMKVALMRANNVVESYHYTSLDDLVHQPRKDKSPKKENSPSQGRKKEHTPPNLGSLSQRSNIKCFKFLGKGHIASQSLKKRNMVMREDESFHEESSSNSGGESLSDYSPYESDLFMVKSLMSTQVDEDSDS